MDFQKLQEIYETVSSLPSQQRHQRLEALCAGDAQLKREVLALLEVDTDQADAFDQPMFDQPSLVGKKLGQYEVIEELGRGGMGRVYLAEQKEPVQRKVAVKFVAWWGLDETMRKRFHSEQINLARMNHPYVARLYETGMYEDGQPYFVMEHIEGLPIHQWCDHHQLSHEARISLFLKVCEGVSHAHIKGVIHRDIKPTNILIVGDAQTAMPKIIDFGIAKTLEDTRLTQAGHSPGSFCYMSPEQSGATGPDGQPRDQDFRTDVYALGVLLFELLVGEPPLRWPDGVQPSQVLEDIRRKPPHKPAKVWQTLPATQKAHRAKHRQASPERIGRLLEGDLTWIVMKALEKDPERRYRSPDDLIRELQRYQQDLPVEAGPPKWSYVFAKFTRRHRTALFGLAAVFFMILAFLVVILMQNDQIRKERDLAQKEANTSKAVSDFIVSILNTGDPIRNKSQDRASEIPVKDVVDRAKETVSEDLADQPEIQLELIGVMSEIYRNWGQYDTSISLHERALAMFDARGVGQGAELAREFHGLGWNHLRKGDHAKAKTLLARAVELQRAAMGETMTTASYLNILAEVYLEQRDWERAAATIEEALAIALRFEENPNDIREMCYYNLGRIYRELNQLDRAEQNYLKALKAFDEGGGHHPQKPGVLYSLSTLYMHRGNFPQAEKMLHRTFELDVHFVGAEHPVVAMDYYALARCYHKLGDLDFAEFLYREALDALAATVGADHHHNILVMSSLGVLLTQTQPEEAMLYNAQAVALGTAAFGDQDMRVVRAAQALAESWNFLGDFNESYRLVKQAKEVLEEKAPADNYHRIKSDAVLGRALVGFGCYAEAEPLLQQAAKGLVDHPISYLSDVDIILETLRQMYQAWEKPSRWESFREGFESGTLSQNKQAQL